MFPKVFYEWTKLTRAQCLWAGKGSNKMLVECKWISSEWLNRRHHIQRERTAILSRQEGSECQNIVRNPLEHFPSPLLGLHVSSLPKTQQRVVQFCICSLLRFPFFCYLISLQTLSAIINCHFLMHLMKLIWKCLNYLVKLPKFAATALARKLQPPISATIGMWKYIFM